MVAASTASRHSWMGQETSWKYLNNLNRHFHVDAAKLQGNAYIFVDYDKMSSFPNTTDASIYRPMCKHPLNPTPVISWPVRRHFKATGPKLKLVTKIPYRTLVNSNWLCLWRRLFGYLIRRSGVWSSSMRDCVFWHNEPRKHMTGRCSVFHDDKPEHSCYSPKPMAWLSKYRNIVLDVFRWT